MPSNGEQICGAAVGAGLVGLGVRLGTGEAVLVRVGDDEGRFVAVFGDGEYKPVGDGVGGWQEDDKIISSDTQTNREI